MTTVLTNGRLLNCVSDQALSDATVVIRDGNIAEVYSDQRPLPSEAEVIDVHGRTILPGLIDAHMHIAFMTGNIYDQAKIAPIRYALWLKNNCERVLQSGFTTVLDCGIANAALRDAIEDGLIAGPRLRIVNDILTRTGGHADFTDVAAGYPIPSGHGLFASVRLVDGVSEARKAAREQIRAGADALKVAVSGGLGSLYAEVTHLMLSEDEIRAIVEEAADVGKYVHVHVGAIEGAKRAVRAGVKVLHHVYYIDDELTQMIKDKGVFVVPTLTTLVKVLLENVGNIPWPPPVQRKIDTVVKPELPQLFGNAERLFKAGCTVGSGADALAGLPLEGWEILYKTQAGMTPYEAIKSATAINSKILQLENCIGTIQAGKWADIIVVDGRPDEDPAIFTDPNSVQLVMKQGVVYKNTLGTQAEVGDDERKHE
jgi:imidazolonepropionase-like amidohydrolase